MLRFIFHSVFTVFIVLSANGNTAGQEAHADSAGTQENGFIYLPIIGYSPETKFMGGAATSYIFRENSGSAEDKPSGITPIFIYTQKKQIIAQTIADVYLKRGKYHITAEAGYLKFPDLFYGIGNNTRSADEEDYTPKTFLINVSFQKKIFKNTYGGLKFSYSDVTIDEYEEGGSLSQGILPGSSGGAASGPGIVLNYDTRDNLFNASKGVFIELNASVFDKGLNSSFNFSRYVADVRKYISLFPQRVLALRLWSSSAFGNIPFQELSSIGGDSIMRGYYQGRFRDNHAFAFQAEYRSPLYKRIGYTVFSSAGNVFHSYSELTEESLNFTSGFGLRFMVLPKEKMNIRMDFGYGRYSSGFYLGFTEVF